MRDQEAVMRLYQQLHRRWRKLAKGRQTAEARWEREQTESAVRALAWVLGLDPESEPGKQQRYLAAEMESPDGRPPLTGMRLTRAWDGGEKVGWYWLLEVPTYENADGQTETVYWAAMLPERVVQELALAFGKAFYQSEPTKELDVVMASLDLADQPTVMDLRALVASVEWSVMDRQTGGAA
jgi:hypothetical protein